MAWVAAIVQGVLGGVQMGVSMAELDKLPEAQRFSTAADLETATSMARRAAQQGMTPEERAVAEQGIGTAQSRTQRAMEQRGLGNLAAAVSQIRTTDALNQLEAQNQAIKRQSLGQYASLAGQIQSIQNQNVQSFNQMLYQQQVALGQAAKAGFSNLTMGLGEAIASGVEGQDKVDEAAMGGSPVTKAQMGMVDTTAQQPSSIDFVNNYQSPSTFQSLSGQSDGLGSLGKDLYQPTNRLIEPTQGGFGSYMQSDVNNAFGKYGFTGIDITPSSSISGFSDQFGLDNYYDGSIGAGYSIAPTN